MAFCRPRGRPMCSICRIRLGAWPEVFPPDTEIGIGPYREDQAGAGGGKLSDGRGQGRPGHTHVEDRDEEQVKPYVQKRCQRQEDEGRLAVPQSPEDRGDPVVERHGYKPGTGDLKIGGSVPHDLLTEFPGW